MIPISIPRRSRHCVACQQMLEPGSEYASALTEESSKGKLGRHDFCVACWNDERIEELKSFWKAKVPEKRSLTKDPEGHYEEVLEMLREEIEKGTKESHGYAFVLALYLTRKRQMALRQEVDIDGDPNYLYEVLNTEEMVCVKKISLSLDALQTIQETLMQKFEH